MRDARSTKSNSPIASQPNVNLSKLSILTSKLKIPAIGCKATMRRTFRLLASAQPSRYLESGTPTGLTGLHTHPTPRASLIYLYSSTLEKLRQIPEHSVYRQSVEAVTRHRLAIVEGTKPPGYDEWHSQARPRLIEQAKLLDPKNQGDVWTVERDGKKFIVQNALATEPDIREVEWNGWVDKLALLPDEPQLDPEADFAAVQAANGLAQKITQQKLEGTEPDAADVETLRKELIRLGWVEPGTTSQQVMQQLLAKDTTESEKPVDHFDAAMNGMEDQDNLLEADPEEDLGKLKWEGEPALTADQYECHDPLDCVLPFSQNTLQNLRN
jgi:hypothetical protein